MTAPIRLTLSRRAGFDLQALSLATNGLPAVNVARGEAKTYPRLGMNRAVIFRMIWIDAWITAGNVPLQREHLRLAFDISIPQVAVDFKTFRTIFPGRMIYDTSAKGYIGQGAPVFAAHQHSAIFLACSVAYAAARTIASAREAV